MYRDSKVFNGNDFHPISISNTGIALISLCIADAMGWNPNAKNQALNSLKSITGHHSVFNPDRNANGYFRHFLDINTGQQAWNSEYSTIDTDIMVSGALFCMNYFQDDSINKYALELWNSVDFGAAISDAQTGEIYLSMNTDGTGVSNAITLPYNEYMIVAWLAFNSFDSVSGVLWNNYYSSPQNLPSIHYSGIGVLTDNPNNFLSSFTHQFNHYLCHYFTTSSAYQNFFRNAQLADSTWWSHQNLNSYEWGHGAGSSFSSAYHADAINNNPDTIVSPHIIAGFIPVNPGSKTDLISLWNAGIAQYELPGFNSDTILWRYSKTSPAWNANEIIGIDYSSMLFGLASLAEYLGNQFFSSNNDFFPLTLSTEDASSFAENIRLVPMPSTNYLKVMGIKNSRNFKIFDLNSRIILEGKIENGNTIDLRDIESGFYLIQFCEDVVLKIIKK